MSNQLKGFIYIGILALIWGSSFILMKLGMYGLGDQIIFNPDQVATLRMLIASSIFVPLSIRHFKNLQNKKDLIYILIVGLCGSFIPAFLFTHAETQINSGLAGMLNSFTPIFTIIVGLIFFSRKSNSKEIIGVLIGTAGVTLLSFFGKQTNEDSEFFHILLVLFATLCYAISLSVIKYKLIHLKSFAITAMSLSMIWIASLCIFLLEKTHMVFINKPNAAQSFVFIFILSLFGTVIATILFNNLIKITSALFASSVTYLMPIVAVAIGLFFGEKIDLFQIFFVCLILLGVFVANSKFKIIKTVLDK